MDSPWDSADPRHRRVSANEKEIESSLILSATFFYLWIEVELTGLLSRPTSELLGRHEVEYRAEGWPELEIGQLWEEGRVSAADFNASVRSQAIRSGIADTR